jgi:SAM-dependent methyltransferase
MKIKKIFRSIKRKIDKYLGSYLDKLIWKYRHRVRNDWEEGYVDEKTNNHRHRKLLLDIFKKKKIINLFEIGTGNGANLIFFAKEMYETEFFGIDLNKKAIQIGKKIININEFKNVRIEIGDIEDIENICKKKYEYILCDAVLMYFNPEKVRIIINKLIEKAEKGILLCEQHEKGGGYYDHWRHDYESILNKLNNKIEYKIINIQDKFWDNDWIKYGKIIDINIKK